MQPFQFKQFAVHQDRCAMKIGTDGVLLGAWAPLDHHPGSILDIGTGTGLIALQLAQRSSAETIDAIELEDNAYEQSVENFEASPWADRLFCYHASLQEFVDEVDETYELIVSNPPFYTEKVTSGNEARDIARQVNSLSFEDLLNGVADMLSETGIFAIIIPFKEEQRFVALARQKGLYANRLTRVKGNQGAAVKRSLLQFSFEDGNTVIEDLTIEKKRHEYTLEYQELTKAFYLKM